MIWFSLLVLTFLVGLFGWITDTVYPEMWAVGEQFGHPPERGRSHCLENDQGRDALRRVHVVDLLVRRRLRLDVEIDTEVHVGVTLLRGLFRFGLLHRSRRGVKREHRSLDRLRLWAVKWESH